MNSDGITLVVGKRWSHLILCGLVSWEVFFSNWKIIPRQATSHAKRGRDYTHMRSGHCMGGTQPRRATAQHKITHTGLWIGPNRGFWKEGRKEKLGRGLGIGMMVEKFSLVVFIVIWLVLLFMYRYTPRASFTEEEMSIFILSPYPSFLLA